MIRIKRWILLFALVGCSEASPFAPEAFTRTPCRPPAELMAMITGPAFIPAELQSALLHAAGRMSLALGDDPEVRSLQGAIYGIEQNISVSQHDGACRMLSISADLFKELPNAPSTLPDRDGIRLILALTAHALTAVVGP
jgi:hypothetical protein